MGKQRKSKCKSQKPCPTGLPSVKDLEKDEEMNGGPTETEKAAHGTINTVIEKLQSPNPEQRLVGCCTLVTLISEPGAVPFILDSGIVRIAICLLQDQQVDVRLAIAGALRNLSAQGAEVCEFLVHEDVMTPLMSIYHKYGATWTPSDGKVDSSSEIFLQLTHLLWNLCEASNIAVSIFNEHKLVNILARCLDYVTFGQDLSIVTAQCLYTVSEENMECCDAIADPNIQNYVTRLLDGADDDNILLKTLAAGILMNVYSQGVTSTRAEMFTSVINTLDATLSHDNGVLLMDIVKDLEKSKNDPENRSKEFDYKLASFNRLCAAQQIGLEILTNICSSNDDEEERDDMDQSDTSDDTMASMDCEVSGDNRASFAGESDRLPSLSMMSISSHIHEAIVSHQISAKVLRLSLLPDTETLQILSSKVSGSVGRKLHQQCCKLNSRSLLCLHNVVSNTDIEELGGASDLYDNWLKLAEQTFAPANVTASQDLMEARSAVLRAIITKLTESTGVHNLIGQRLMSSDIRHMVRSAHKILSSDGSGSHSNATSLQDNTRVNIIRTLGMIGCLLIGPNGCNLSSVYPIVEDVSNLLLDIVGKEQQLWVLAETLDTIFDFFGEDWMYEIGSRVGLVPKLKTILPVVKSKINLNRKHLGEHYPIIMTVKINLPKFIKYKDKRI